MLTAALITMTITTAVMLLASLLSKKQLLTEKSDRRLHFNS